MRELLYKSVFEGLQIVLLLALAVFGWIAVGEYVLPPFTTLVLRAACIFVGTLVIGRVFFPTIK